MGKSGQAPPRQLERGAGHGGNLPAGFFMLRGAGEACAAALLLGLAALLVITPLLVKGPSCGHDFTFHLQSWIDVAAQLRHGTLLPRWAVSAAWNAGEPRYVFYPPLSWLLGASLELLFPIRSVPLVFTWIALTAAGLALYRLARDYAPSAACLIAATVYLAGPYALFTAYERTAYAELLAAAWLPLLLRSALLPQPSVVGTAVPLALLWLTNAPAAVMGTYAFVLLVGCRVGADLLGARRAVAPEAPHGTERRLPPRKLLLRFGPGVLLGFALAGFYLVPAAYERRWVQIAMAIIPNLRVQDNFLFGHTGDGPHDAVLRTASWLAVGLLVATMAALLLAWYRTAYQVRKDRADRLFLLGSALLAVVIGFLLTRTSELLWEYVPELSFLQFPWRLLALLSLVLAGTVSLVLARVRLSPSLTTAVCLLLAGAAGAIANQSFRQACEASDEPNLRLELFTSGHGVSPTDEYTPGDADNDVLRPDDPPFWLAADPSDAQAFAPGTTPNPASTHPDTDVSFPAEKTLSGHAPQALTLRLPAPAVLVLNLRAYPAWHVLRNGQPWPVVHRDDGLLALRLPAGESTVNIRWQHTPDVLAGDALSAAALVMLSLSFVRSRKLDVSDDR